MGESAAQHWADWFESWRLTLETKGRRPKTIEFYGRELARFGRHVDTHPLRVTRPQIREWVKAQIDRGLAANTVAGRLIVTQSFYTWLVDEGELGVSPATGVSSPPHRGPAPDVMTDAEFDKLLAACSGPGVYERRNRAILLVLASSGCRLSELCSMTDKGTNLRDRRIDVEGKGGVWRPVPISTRAAEAVDRYRRARSQLRGGRGALWWGKAGALTDRGVDNMLKKLERQTGVKVHAHRFRHKFSHEWLDAGGSEAGLQTAAGWSSVVMPRRYGRAMATERMLGEHHRLFDG